MIRGKSFVHVLIAVGVVALAIMMVSLKQNEDVRENALKTKEVIGTVVGGPQIVTGNPLIGYAVFVKELNGMVALHAEQCPPLGNGQKIAMFQKDGLSKWYTFIRYE